MEPIQSFNKNELTSDRLDFYLKQVQECIKELPNWLGSIFLLI